MNTPEIKKAQAQNITGIIEYVPKSVVSMDIIRKTTGSVSIIAFDSGEELHRKICPFDIFIEMIEGVAEIVIDDKSTLLKTGQAIIIPAHAPNSIIASERCKMLVTTIKSGYEQEL
jgi:quercetin dioxygenase-like cupin family protein